MMKKFACLIAGILIVFCALHRAHAHTGNELPRPGDAIQYNTPLTFCQGGGVVLSVTNTTGYTYVWQHSTDGGNTWTNVGTQDSYGANSSGLYWVIETSNGVSDTLAPVTVTVHPNPAASFTFTPNNGCGTNPLAFTNTSTGAGLP